MRKKISLLMVVLTLVLAFTAGCSNSQKGIDYDEAAVSQVAEFMITNCATMDDVTVAQLKDLRESTFEQTLAASNIPATPKVFLAAIDSWKAGEEECGAYIEHGDYTFKATAKELVVSTDAKFEKRDATIEFVFDKDMYLDSVTVGGKYSKGEIAEKAALNTLLGMGTVFSVLILISLIISLFKFIPQIQEKFRKKPEAAEVVKDIPVAEIVQTEADEEAGNEELVAVIAAAIAAAEGTTTDGFVVRSIRRRKTNKWN